MTDTTNTETGPNGPRIDIQDESTLHAWAAKLDVTPDQLKEAVGVVGDLAGDVEMHLKGSRSSSNSDRVQDALGRIRS